MIQHRPSRQRGRAYSTSAIAALLALGLATQARCADNVRGKIGPKVFTAADVFALKSVVDTQISPNGRYIAFVEHAADISTDREVASLWIVETTGGAPRQLVAGSASEPKWSPDSSHIAFLAADAEGKTQIKIVTPAGGEPRILTHIDTGPSDLAWSPDASDLAFTAFATEPPERLGPALTPPPGAKWAAPPRFTTAAHYSADGQGDVTPGHTHLFLVSTDSGAVRALTSGHGDEASPVWTPDGSAVLFSARAADAPLLDLSAHRIWQIDVASGRSRRLSPDPIDATEPAISPDGRRIAFVGWAPRKPGDFYPIDIYVMDRDGAHARVLIPNLDRLTYHPLWSADGRSVFASYTDRSVDTLASLGLDGAVTILARHADDAYSVSHDGVLAFPLEGEDHPDDLGLLASGKVRRLTRLNEGLLGGLRLATVRPLPVRSSLDGAEVGTWMTLPPGFEPGKRYPTLLQMHGGPYFEDGPEWSTDTQLFASAGYVVLHANYRGSTSYGLAFSTRVDRDFPGAAYGDLMSAIDAAIAVGVADPSRLYVTGGSAGGQLTAWIVGKTRRFRAAAALKPIIDASSEALTTDQYLYDAVSEFATTPWRDPQLFWSHSALSLVANVTTPTLLMVGDEDRRTPPDQAREFYDALKIRGVPTGLVIVPGASHESLESRPSQHADEDLAILAWFARFGGPPVP